MFEKQNKIYNKNSYPGPFFVKIWQKNEIFQKKKIESIIKN